MKQLPESFCIAREDRTPETCQRWRRFIEWINKKNTLTINGSVRSFYGNANSYDDFPFGQLLTLDQFEEIMGWKETVYAREWFLESNDRGIITKTEEQFKRAVEFLHTRNSGEYSCINQFEHFKENSYVCKNGYSSINNRTESSDLVPFEKVFPSEPEQWQPKPGEMVQVSDDGEKWHEREFIGWAKKITGYKFITYHSDFSCTCFWKFCRPIPKVTTYSRSEAIKLISEHTGKPESEIEITD